MSRISEYAKKQGLPLVVACGQGIEGDGILHSISQSRAVVRYDGFDKEYKLPEEMDDFCLVDGYLDEKMRSAFQRFVEVGGLRWENENYGKYLCTRHIKSIDTDARCALKKEFPIKSRFLSRYQGEEKSLSCGFFGEYAGDIAFADERDFVVALAYLASPGKCSLVADVPPNHYSEFEALFPHTSYGHIESHNGGNCQFSILFHGNLSDMPAALSENTLPSASDRIIRSAFTYDLVEHRGFVFGNTQDVEEIRRRILEHYRDIFDEALSSFQKQKQKDSEEIAENER